MRRRFTHILALSVAVVIAASPAMAERAPRKGNYDSRIRTVVYRADDVVKVEATYGVSLMITFGTDEVVETVSLGDSDAWAVVANRRNNVLFIKPIAKNADTNLTVITNKRDYSFDLYSHSGRAKSGQTYKIKFLYPDEEYDAKLMDQARENVQNPNLSNLDVANVNTDYAYKGDDEVAPATVFDDGVKTFFKFKGDVPAIYMVDGKRNETLVNSRREAEYIVVDGVKRQWTLRLGNQVTCVFNLRAGRPSPAPSADGMTAPRKMGSTIVSRNTVR
jgi:type IV secretion system protein VirB9